MARAKFVGDETLSNSQRIRLNCPDILERFNEFYETLWRSTRVSASIKELIRLRCATMNECHY